MKPRVAAIVLAAGRGERFGADKVNLSLGGKPVWRWSFEAFLAHPEVDEVGLVCAAEHVEAYRIAAPEAAFVVAGGASRQESSELGVQATQAEIVLVHDAARPFVSTGLVSRVLDGVREAGAAAPSLPMTDTVKQRDGDAWRTLDRQALRTVQTPQGARRDLLLQAFEAALEEGRTCTDELSAMEAIGVRPELVEGDEGNMKITHPGDLEKALARFGTETRVGFGYDVHAFSDDPGRVLMLGGVAFEGHRALAGHSDADVLLHAIADAVLGAAGLPDIGHHFPNTDSEWKDRPSLDFVARAASLVSSEGWRVTNVDATLIAESPKIGPKREAIRAGIAAALGIEPDCVGIKATTHEGIGAMGRGEGISAHAVATLVRIRL